MSNGDHPIFFASFEYLHYNDDARISYRVRASDYPNIPAARLALNEILFYVVERLPQPRIRINRVTFRDLLRDEFTVDDNFILELFLSSSPEINLREVSSLLNPYTFPPLEN